MEMGRLAPASGRLPSRLGARSPSVTMTVGRGVAADSVRWVAAALRSLGGGEDGRLDLGNLRLAAGSGEGAGAGHDGEAEGAAAG